MPLPRVMSMIGLSCQNRHDSPKTKPNRAAKQMGFEIAAIAALLGLTETEVQEILNQVSEVEV